MSEKVGGRPLKVEDLNVIVYNPSDVDSSDDDMRQSRGLVGSDFGSEASYIQPKDDLKRDMDGSGDVEKLNEFDDATEDVNQDQKNGDIVLLSVDLDLNSDKDNRPTVSKTAEGEHNKSVNQSATEQTAMEERVQTAEQKRRRSGWFGRKEQREQAKKQERAQRDSWYETLKKAADAGKTGDWMSHEEKVESGLVDDYKGISAEAKLLQDLRLDLDEEKGALYEVQRYEFKTPEDVERYAKAAEEVLHYEKNTMVGTQNLEVQFAPGVKETWEGRRNALVDEQWQWVRDVLPDWPYEDQRDVQRVYLDFIEYLHEPGNEHDSFVDYLERAVPECKIEPTKRNIDELVVGRDEREKDLLSATNQYDERYYSDEEVAAVLKMYDRAQIMTRYAEAAEHHDQKSTKKTRHREPQERAGVRSSVFDKLKKPSDDGDKSNVVQFPDDGVNAGAFVAVDKRPSLNKASTGNKPFDAERFVPNEEGLQMLDAIADYCLDRARAAEAYDDEQHAALAERWRSDYLKALDNINLLSITLADRRATQVEEQQKESDRRAVMRGMQQEWNEYSASEIVERYAKNYDLDKSKPVINQLQDLYGKLRQGLIAACAARDKAGQTAYLDAMHELGEVLTRLGPDGQEALQKSTKEIIA